MVVEQRVLVYFDELVMALTKTYGKTMDTHIYSPRDILSSIQGLRHVDAVPVVRCKDCKWYKEGELLAPNKFCFRLKHPTEDRNVGYNFCDDDFCSYGERNDNVR